MNEYQQTLQSLINNSEDTCENIDDSITLIDNQIDEIQTQIDGIENGMINPILSDMSAILEIKMIEFNGNIIDLSGVGYGITTIDNFLIIDSTTSTTVYEYEGINWDSDPDIIQYITEFDWAYDYLYKEIDENGTYGLYPKLLQLQMGKSLLEANKLKYQESTTKFSRFV